MPLPIESMHQPTPEGAQQSLRDHVVAKAIEARHKCDGRVDRAAVERLLLDRSVVRYPIGVRFDGRPLRAGEFACLESLGDHPSHGFCLFMHPAIAPHDDLFPALVAYYLPSVNYGDVATHVEAELFGATLLGITVEQYYHLLCTVADDLPSPAASHQSPEEFPS